MAALLFVLAGSPALGASADRLSSPAVNESALISLLQSNAPPAEKALACKQLAIYGHEEAVRALAPLLSDPQLASWARIALEAIPGPAADAALRRALGRSQGKLLVGVINSIGVRRDPEAVSGLVKKLKAAEVEVASASAVALGRIGGAKAAKALDQSLKAARAEVRPAAAEGCILCAEGFLAQGQPAEAVKLYDAVRAARVPRQKQLEATRGAILARQSAGLPLLLEQLRSPDKALFGIGLRTARELPGRAVTEALAAELARTSPDRQSFLLLALADRNDAAVMPAVEAAAGGDPSKLRLTAISVLERQGGLTSVPVLLKAASEADDEVAQAGLGALTRLPGNEVDADLLARLPSATGKTRQALITVAGRRHIARALPEIVRSAEGSDAGVRVVAVQAIGVLGDDTQIAGLVRLLSATQSAKERGEVETALLAISGRAGARAASPVLPLAQSTDSALRVTALHVLAAAGGPDALAAVEAAVQDKEEMVQDEAVRTLSTWPNNWPEDSRVAQPLLTWARSAPKPSHQVLALRGYLQYLEGAKQLKDDERLAKIAEVLHLANRPEEKRLALAAISTVHNARALEMLVAFAAEPAVAEDACSAIVKLTDPAPPGVSLEQRRQALQTVVETTTSDGTKQQARKLLKPPQ